MYLKRSTLIFFYFFVLLNISALLLNDPEFRTFFLFNLRCCNIHHLISLFMQLQHNINTEMFFFFNECSKMCSMKWVGLKNRNKLFQSPVRYRLVWNQKLLPLWFSFHSPILGSSEELKQFGLFCPTVTPMSLSGFQIVPTYSPVFLDACDQEEGLSFPKPKGNFCMCR